MSTLYIVATPIGNLADISIRALEILKHVDLIAAEDTRHSVQLLKHYHITTRLIAYHEHNEHAVTENLCLQLQQGKSVALISDAGTPLINDPGYQLVKAAHQAHIKVVPVPGACAAVAALSVAGLASDRFTYEGFLPSKSSARLAKLQHLQQEPRSMIFYEAPHRIIEMLTDAKAVFGDQRPATLARELTKTFETIRLATLSELVSWLNQDQQQTKGEFVVIIAGANADEVKQSQQQKAEALLRKLLVDLPVKKAVQLTAEIMQASKNDLYDLALKLK